MKIASAASLLLGAMRVGVGSAADAERVFQPLLGGVVKDDLHSRPKTVLASSTIRRKANALSIWKVMKKRDERVKEGFLF
jgi:hypothetical protein